ncbi:MAG: asparagine synthetase B, partial [Leptolyngbya sp.]|nr:asparagine synthetase B [Candidatus Melainabacteria bacterium]
YILKEAVKPFITETIYSRQKHPFVAPPVSAFSDASAKNLLNDTLRSKKFASIPFFDQAEIIKTLDSMEKLTEGERSAMDPVLMMVVSAACIQDRFKL